MLTSVFIVDMARSRETGRKTKAPKVPKVKKSAKPVLLFAAPVTKRTPNVSCTPTLTSMETPTLTRTPTPTPFQTPTHRPVPKTLENMIDHVQKHGQSEKFYNWTSIMEEVKTENLCHKFNLSNTKETIYGSDDGMMDMRKSGTSNYEEKSINRFQETGTPVTHINYNEPEHNSNDYVFIDGDWSILTDEIKKKPLPKFKVVNEKK